MKSDVIEGKIWLFGNNVNTDLIIPPAYLTVNDPSQIVQHAFDGIRTGFSKIINKGDIIVAGKNFGSGSSREEAVFVLTQLGISCVIAESFSRIYFRNLINQGIPAITIDPNLNEFKEGDILRVDLKMGKITNLKSNKITNFKPIPKYIMDLIENGGAIPALKKTFSVSK